MTNAPEVPEWFKDASEKIYEEHCKQFSRYIKYPKDILRTLTEVYTQAHDNRQVGPSASQEEWARDRAKDIYDDALLKGHQVIDTENNPRTRELALKHIQLIILQHLSSLPAPSEASKEEIELEECAKDIWSYLLHSDDEVDMETLMEILSSHINPLPDGVVLGIEEPPKLEGEVGEVVEYFENLYKKYNNEMYKRSASIITALVEQKKKFLSRLNDEINSADELREEIEDLKVERDALQKRVENLETELKAYVDSELSN